MDEGRYREIMGLGICKQPDFASGHRSQRYTYSGAFCLALFTSRVAPTNRLTRNPGVDF